LGRTPLSGTIGAIIGGFVTAIAVLVTIRHERKQREEAIAHESSERIKEIALERTTQRIARARSAIGSLHTAAVRYTIITDAWLGEDRDRQINAGLDLMTALNVAIIDAEQYGDKVDHLRGRIIAFQTSFANWVGNVEIDDNDSLANSSSQARGLAEFAIDRLREFDAEQRTT
jgi:hypothetical protein